MKKTIRVIIIFIAAIAACLLYTNFYHIESQEDMRLAISEEISNDVEIIDVKAFKEDKLVTFRFKDHEGFIAMSLGMNGKYNLESGYYLSDHDQLKISDYELGGVHYLVVYGENPGKTVTLQSTSGPISLSSLDTRLLEIIETDIKERSIFSYEYYVNGERTIVERDVDIEAAIDYSGYINNGPRHLVFASSLLILLIGFIASFAFTPRQGRLEKWFYKLTKHHPSMDDGVGQSKPPYRT